ncbi:MAG: 4Fe-4S binding protein [Desulfobacterales bacterium]|nr:4Fe-4S binding protein [Desulfobacterales bacterium]
MKNDTNLVNTLKYNPDMCKGCRICITVCPHGVFEEQGRVVMINKDACMECGACQRNCPHGAVTVESGVGCAYAMMRDAISQKIGFSCQKSSGPSCGCNC